MKFYRIKFDSIYLSNDGLNGTGSIPAKLTAPGADALLSSFTGSTVISIDGTPIQQIFETGSAGKNLEVRVETYLYKPVWELIIELINEALENDGTINVVGTGDIGNFDVAARPLLPRPFEAEGFENGRILKPIFRFITT